MFGIIVWRLEDIIRLVLFGLVVLIFIIIGIYCWISKIVKKIKKKFLRK